MRDPAWPGEPDSVRLTGSVPFRYVLLQARRAPSEADANGVNEPTGMFNPVSEWKRFGIQGLKCGTSQSEMFAAVDTITHLNTDKKFVLKLDWTAPTNNVGPVQFM